MLRRNCCVVLTASLGILAWAQHSIYRRIQPTEYFCRTLMLPGYKMYMARPYSTMPFELWPFWIRYDLLLVYVFCRSIDNYFMGAVVQLQCEGQPYGTFIQDKHVPIEYVDCPPGVNNTAFNFSAEPERSMGFFWLPPEEMEWANVTVYASVYGMGKDFWLVEKKLHMYVEKPYDLIRQ